MIIALKSLIFIPTVTNYFRIDSIILIYVLAFLLISINFLSIIKQNVFMQFDFNMN